MSRAYLPLLLLLSAIWGASYLFIKVAVEEIEPTAMVELRLLLASAVLVGFLAAREGLKGALRSLRRAGRDGLVLGTVNAAVPFFLIAWGEKYIDSGVAAIANATVPIFNFLLAIYVLPSERISGLRLGGVLLGLVGVAVLVGFDPTGGWWAVAGTLAVVLASLLYAAGGIYGQVRVAETRGPVLAAASMVGATLVMLPFGAVQAPHDVPGWKALGSVAALGLLGTGLAQLILFRMLRLHGSARTSLVTYLLPVFALFYGALLLDEPLTAAALGGLALILLGVAVGSGVLRLPRRAAVTPAP